MPKSMSRRNKTRWRYVELTYRLPNVSRPEEDQQRDTIVRAANPGLAFEQARVELLKEHPHAHDIQEFMQRVLANEQADKIRAQMLVGTWEGWKFTGQGV